MKEDLKELVKERIKELFEVEKKVNEFGGFHTEEIPSDKEGSIFRVYYLGDVELRREYVEVYVPGTDDETPDADGTYLHPFPWSEGVEVIEGKWYLMSDGNIWEAKKDGIPESETDDEYFDIVM